MNSIRQSRFTAESEQDKSHIIKISFYNNSAFPAINVASPMPLVSVIMPVYNGVQFIEESIASIFKQSLRDIELIIVDDGSTDGTESVISSLKDSRVRYLCHSQNQGVAATTCTGLDAATGKYIALLDQDDIALPDRLSKQVRIMNGQPRLSILGGQMTCFGAADVRITPPLTDCDIKANLLSGTANINNPTVMIRHDFLIKNSLRWKPENRIVFDWGFYVDAMLAGAKFSNLPESLIRYRVHGGQQSSDQSILPIIKHNIRLKIIAAFFPNLSAEEQIVLSPLLQWLAPSGLTSAAVHEGLHLIAKALTHTKSEYGESRVTLGNFLSACEQRWRQALAHTSQ